MIVLMFYCNGNLLLPHFGIPRLDDSRPALLALSAILSVA